VGKKVSEELNVCFDPQGFRIEVAQELEEERRLLDKLTSPHNREAWGHTIAIVLLAASVSAIYFYPDLLYTWLLVGLLLYSYNFIILMLPTTTDHSRPYETKVLHSKGKDEHWLAFKLLAKKWKLAIDLGLTVFLGGMVPLLLSFTIIFGVGLFFAVYFSLFTHLIDWNTSFAVIIQILLILGFYVMMYLLEPEAQGISKFARTLRGRYGEVRTKGGSALVLFFMIVISLAIVGGLLAIGAILLPGTTLATLLSKLVHFGQVEYVYGVIVFVVQLFIMRHFQGVTSRSMAVGLLKERVRMMQNEVLTPFEELISHPEYSPEQFEAEFEVLRRKYYAQVIYDVIKVDFFGRSPVYLIGPRLKYVLDDKVLNHFHS